MRYQLTYRRQAAAALVAPGVPLVKKVSAQKSSQIHTHREQHHVHVPLRRHQHQTTHPAHLQQDLATTDLSQKASAHQNHTPSTPSMTVTKKHSSRLALSRKHGVGNAPLTPFSWSGWLPAQPAVLFRKGGTAPPQTASASNTSLERGGLAKG